MINFDVHKQEGMSFDSDDMALLRSYEKTIFDDIVELNRLIKQGIIEFYAFINHQPEEDEKKPHKHLFITPSTSVDTFHLQDILSEPDVLHPDLPPLGCKVFKRSKFGDWFMYVIHDKDYLATKGESRKYHYLKDDIICSDEDTLNENIHTSDFSKYNCIARVRDAVKSGQSFQELFENGFIPVQQIIQYKKAYNLLKYGNMDVDEKTFRNGHSGHEDDDSDVIEEDNMRPINTSKMPFEEPK